MKTVQGRQGALAWLICHDDYAPLAVSLSQVWHWLNQFAAGKAGWPGMGKPITAEQQRLRQLALEDRQLRGDVESLKKHLAAQPVLALNLLRGTMRTVYQPPGAMPHAPCPMCKYGLAYPSLP